MKKNRIITYSVIAILSTGIIYWIIKDIPWKENEYIGRLKHQCSSEYAIDIYEEYRGTNWKQDVLYFELLKNDSVISKRLSYATTLGRENINDFEIKCYENVLYVLTESFSFPWIIFDTKTHQFYPNGESNEKEIKKLLFDRIKKGDPNLTWNGTLFLANLTNSCNRDFSIELSYSPIYSDETPFVFFSIFKKDSLLGSGDLKLKYEPERTENNFQTYCNNNVLYITENNQDTPLIILDIQSNKFYPNDSENEEIKKQLFEKIK